MGSLVNEWRKLRKGEPLSIESRWRTRKKGVISFLYISLSRLLSLTPPFTLINSYSHLFFPLHLPLIFPLNHSLSLFPSFSVSLFPPLFLLLFLTHSLSHFFYSYFQHSSLSNVSLPLPSSSFSHSLNLFSHFQQPSLLISPYLCSSFSSSQSLSVPFLPSQSPITTGH